MRRIHKFQKGCAFSDLEVAHDLGSFGVRCSLLKGTLFGGSRDLVTTCDGGCHPPH